MKPLILLSLSALFLGACNSDNAILGLEDTGEIGEEEPVDPYEGATLEIISPDANSFLAYGDEAAFEAVLWGKDGNPLIFEEINWNSTIDEAWRHAGGAFSNAELDVGIHLLRVNAELPNGERLFDAVGGILVQSEHAGTYAIQGQVMELDYIFDLEVEDESLEGEAALSIYGFDLPTDFSGELSGGKNINGYWSQSVFGQMELEGEVRLERVSRDTHLYE
jgi:hypothetical protein